MMKKLLLMPSTISIILIWIAVWILVSIKDYSPLLASKGISKVGNEYYRFLTGCLTHTNLLHLFFNAAAMFWVGYLYEERLGSLRFLLIAVGCAILANVIYLSIYRNSDYSIGGSLFTYALCGFGLTAQCLIPGFPKISLGTWSGNWLAVSLIVGNIPILSFMNVTTLIVHVLAFIVGILVAILYKLIICN